MAEAKDRTAWNRTFALLAQTYNVNRDPEKSDPIDPMQFFPWQVPEASPPPPPPTPEECKLLRQVFPGKGK